MTCRPRWVALFVAQLVPGVLAAQAAGSVIGYVTSQTGGSPIAWLDVTVSDYRIATLASDKGVFYIKAVPAGPITLRVRRIGFRPADVKLTVHADGLDTVRVDLAPLPADLPEMRVADELCPGRPRGDATTLAVLDRMRINAERSGIVDHEFPFITIMERTVADVQADRSLIGADARQSKPRIDTATVGGFHDRTRLRTPTASGRRVSTRWTAPRASASSSRRSNQFATPTCAGRSISTR